MRLLLLPTMLLSTTLLAQQTNQEKFVLDAHRVLNPVKVDGDLTEPEWDNANESTPFLNKWPMDTGKAEARTVVKIMFDNQFLYVGAVSYQKREDLIIQTLKRDQLQPFWAGDGFTIILDPINKKTNGLMFGVNAGGAQIESSLNLSGA